MSVPDTQRGGREYKEDVETTITDSITVDDDGTIRLDTSDGNGVFFPDDQPVYFGGDLDASVDWDTSEPQLRLRNLVDGADWLRLKPSTHADGKRVDVLETLNVGDHNIEDAQNILITDGQNGGIFLGGDSNSQKFSINNNSGTNLLTTYGDGLVEVVNGDLRLPTGNAIEDGGGTNRLEAISNRTKILNPDGTEKFRADVDYAQVFAHSGEDFIVRDAQGAYNLLRAETAASAPGTLTLKADTFIDDGAGLVVGDATKTDIGASLQVQQHGTSTIDTRMGQARWSNDSGGSEFRIGKSRGGSIGTHTAVNTGDFLWSMFVHGSDGTDFERAARLDIRVDGSVADNQVPGRFEFKTSGPSGTMADALLLDSSQDANLPNGVLKVSGTQVVGSQQSAIASLTNNLGDTTTDGTLEALSGSYTAAEIERNFAELNAKYNELKTAMESHGLVAT